MGDRTPSFSTVRLDIPRVSYVGQRHSAHSGQRKQQNDQAFPSRDRSMRAICAQRSTHDRRRADVADAAMAKDVIAIPKPMEGDAIVSEVVQSLVLQETFFTTYEEDPVVLSQILREERVALSTGA